MSVKAEPGTPFNTWRKEMAKLSYEFEVPDENKKKVIRLLTNEMGYIDHVNNLLMEASQDPDFDEDTFEKPSREEFLRLRLARELERWWAKALRRDAERKTRRANKVTFT